MADPENKADKGYSLKDQEKDAQNYWGLQYDRHGIFSEPVVEVSWDDISRPLNSLEQDLMNGVLTSNSLPEVILNRQWAGIDGSASSPSIAFGADADTGIYRNLSGEIGFADEGQERMTVGEDEVTIKVDLQFSPSATHDIGSGAAVLYAKNPRNIFATGRFSWLDTGTHWATLAQANTVDRTYTFQDASGTIFQSGGTDIPVADGGTGASTAVAGFDTLAPTTTKGDVIVHNGSDNIRVGVGGNNEVLVADSTEASGVKWSLTAGGSALVRYKAGDEDVTNSDVLQNDDHLFFAIAANTTYCGTLVLYTKDFNASGSADLQIKIAVPTGAVIRYGSGGGEGVVTLGEDSEDYTDSAAGVMVFTHTNTNTYTHEIKFSVENSTNAGNVQLQWSQNTPQSLAVRLVKGSYLEATKV